MATNNNEPITGTPPDGTVKETEQKPTSPTGTTTTPTPTTQNKPTSGTDGQVVQQNTSNVGDDMVTLPDAPDMSEQYAALDYAAKIYNDGMEQTKLKSPEELEKERKRQKREKIIAAVGDGISALSNLYFTTQYAPNMYNSANSMSDKTQARFDKANAEYEKQKAEHLNYAMNYAKTIGDKGTMKLNEWKNEVSNILAKAKEKRESANAAANLALTEQRTVTEGYKSDKAKVEAENAPTVAKDAHDLSVARQGQAKSSAAASAASATLSRAKTESENNKGATFRGQTYTNRDNYIKAVNAAVAEWNADKAHAGDQIATTEKIGRNTQRRSIQDLAQDVESRLEMASYKR